MNETTYYEDGEITVSDERIVTKKGEYSTRDINSVETEATPVFWGSLLSGFLGMVLLPAYGLGLLFLLPVGYLLYTKFTVGCETVNVRVNGHQQGILTLVTSARAREVRQAISQAMTSRRSSDA